VWTGRRSGVHCCCQSGDKECAGCMHCGRLSRSTNDARETYLSQQRSPAARVLYTAYSAASASQRKQAFHLQSLSHLASVVPSPRVIFREHEEYERSARVRNHLPKDVPRRVNLRVRRVRFPSCHFDELIVDGDVVSWRKARSAAN
jgi:hypothetical protein